MLQSPRGQLNAKGLYASVERSQMPSFTSRNSAFSPICSPRQETSFQSTYSRKKGMNCKDGNEPVDEVFLGFKQRMRNEHDKKLELGLDAADIKSPKNKGLISNFKQLEEPQDTERQTENDSQPKMSLTA